MSSLRAMFVSVALVSLLAVSPALLCASTITFTESLGSNPFSSAGGNFSISNAPGLSSDTSSQFTWDASTVSKYAGDPAGSLKAAYDSNKPAVRLERSLPTTVGMGNDFSVGARMTIRSSGLIADPFGFSEISFALGNHSLTGADRSGGPSGDTSDAYQQIEFDYFPNSGPFGGPTLQVTAFGAHLPTATNGAFSNFASPDTKESDLGSNSAGQINTLPLDTPLDIDISYKASTQIITLKMSRVQSNGSLTQLMLSDTGVIDIDLSGAEYSNATYPSNNFDKSYPFLADSLMITSYFDSWAVDPLPSVHANVEFDQFSFSAAQSTPEPVTMLLLGTGAVVLLRRKRS